MDQSLFCKALGWALFHSLWQFGVLWMLYFGFTALFKKISASLRHAVALLFNVAGMAWFTGTLVSACVSGNYGPAADMPFGWPAGHFTAVKNLSDHYLVYLTYLYILITTLQFSRFLSVFYHSQKLFLSGVSKIPVELRCFVQKTARQLDIRRQVQAFISEHVDTPMVIGFLKPTILMPVACVNQLTIAQLESILLHELAHIKRNDYLINIFVAVCEILFFFNPFARLLLQSVKNEREHSCDDWVLQHQFNAYQYASALLLLEKSRTGYVRTGLAATGASRSILLFRVQRILNVPVSTRNRIVPVTAFLGICGLLLAVVWLNTSARQPEDGLKKGLFAVAERLHLRHPRSLHLQQKVFAAEMPLTVISTSLKTLKAAVHYPVQKSPATFTENDETVLPVAFTHDLANLEPIQAAAVNIEARNFSLPAPVEPETPPAEALTGFPYVPSSSFYAYVDTAKPRVKPETYYERTARESLLKAKKALNEIDWKTIEKTLPKKVNITLLRRQIESSIDQLNWQAISDQVKDSLNRLTRLDYQHTIKQEFMELDKWKAQTAQFQKLQEQLKEQQQRYKTEAQAREADVQKQVSKGKVTVIL